MFWAFQGLSSSFAQCCLTEKMNLTHFIDKNEMNESEIIRHSGDNVKWDPSLSY